MASIVLEPDATHCIETVARHEFQDAQRRILASDQVDAALRERAEMLRSFLESADFRRLRAESEPHLLEGERVTFTLCWGGGSVRWEMRIESGGGGRPR
jgi:hypothetical protein